MEKLRVLCLHGNQQTSEIFRARLGRLPHRARRVASFEFVEAPHELPLREGDEVPTHAWWTSDEDGSTQFLEESIKVVKSAIEKKKPHGLLGFSAGGSMAARVVHEQDDVVNGIKFVLVAGSPSMNAAGFFWDGVGTKELEVPSLHVMGEKDGLVSIEASMELAKRFKDPRIFKHEQGHCVPSIKSAHDVFVEFFEQMHERCFGKSGFICESESCLQEQKDELDALESIYEGALEIIQPLPLNVGDPCAALMIDLTVPEVKLKVAFTSLYPESILHVELCHSFDLLKFSRQKEAAIIENILSELENSIGMPMVFVAVSTAEEALNSIEWKNDVKADVVGEEENDEEGNLKRINEEAESEIVTQATEKACEEVLKRMQSPRNDAGQVAQGRGVKQFVVGLVGKPSAGKSTFFNCCTRLQNEAKVAAHPFTTIEPNFGVGWWASNDLYDIELMEEIEMDGKRRRLLPLVVKDVAGLIPGAYQGHGKGNKFLNDLCDADVLIHVCDCSGESDKNGVAVMDDTDSASTAEEDIKWVREELHRWIFGNLVSKWRSVVRAARDKHADRAGEERLVQLMTGYQGATKSIVVAAAFRAELDLAAVETWGILDLHLFVAHFLSVRFPMCLALNKCDRLLASGRMGMLEKAKEAAAAQGYLAIPCSAMLESELLRDAAEGKLQYVLGASVVKGNVSEQTKQMLEFFGSTGVVECISQAVALREPLLVYPVVQNDQSFKECLQCFPGTTVEDVFSALKRGVVDSFRLQGDFVRAEATSRKPNGAIKLLGKDHVLSEGTNVLKILTNRKVHWQFKSIATN